MNDWAEEVSERWSQWYDGENGDPKVYDAIEGAVREALAKAAEVAIKTCACGHADECVCGYAADAIRALGAAK